MIDKLGLDAVAYLRFLRMLRYMFLAIATLVCAVLLPCDLIYNFKNVKSDARDPLSMLTIQKVKGNLLFVHVAISYLCAFLFVGLDSPALLTSLSPQNPRYCLLVHLDQLKAHGGPQMALFQIQGLPKQFGLEIHHDHSSLQEEPER